MKPDVKAIRARADAATAGEWSAMRFEHGEERRGWLVEHVLGVIRGANEVDARFIAAARTDVPALCDRVEALEIALREILGTVGGDSEDFELALTDARDVLEGE